MKGVYLMGEGGHRIRGAEARKGATLVGVKQSRLSCQGGESDGENTFEDFRNGLEEDDDAEGGWGVVGWFAGLVKDNPVGVLETGGMVPEGD